MLVTEPARDGGKIVTARKGVGRFELTVTGRQAHAGAQHQDGRSAIKELAHHILEIEGYTDYERGVTTNVGLVQAGTGVNVVPRDATAEIDLRVVTAADGEAMTARILDRVARDPDVTVVATGGMNRPPYERSPAIEALFEQARALAGNGGLDLVSTPLTGGGSRTATSPPPSASRRWTASAPTARARTPCTSRSTSRPWSPVPACGSNCWRA